MKILALLACLASVFVAGTTGGVKWCVTSDAELRKCMDLTSHSQNFTCVRGHNAYECILLITAHKADAITLNGGDIFTAGLRYTHLVPIAAEYYAPRREATHQKRPYYSVAVVKKKSTFHIRDLKGKRSCHSGLKDPEGWITPMGTLVSLKLLQWPQVENKPLEQVVSEFFFSSCVPGVINSPNLCNLCKGDCTQSDREPFSGNAGAFKCLEEDGGEVAFVRHDAVPESEKSRYDLLCQDNSRAPIDSYEFCNLGKAGEDDVTTLEDPDSSSCQYAVAVVKKGTTFGIHELQGKRSCHTGLKDFEGWYLPIGTLLTMGHLWWTIEDLWLHTVEDAVEHFFHSSCIPGAKGNLCRLCKGDCSKSEKEPYYGSDGAFRCLEENTGDVAFMKHGTIPDSKKANYELLCTDNTRAPLDNYTSCNLGRVPAHAVVSREDPELADFIWTSLNSVQGFNLFSSANYAPAKNLMFTDSTARLIQVPKNTDSSLYLGVEAMSIMRSFTTVQFRDAASEPIKWCAVGLAELDKCYVWNAFSTSHDKRVISCKRADTIEECIKMILRKEADAVVMDAAHVYTAGKCGLVPVMVEEYNEASCATPEVSSHYAVAVIKKGSHVNWHNMQGKRSCHGAIGSSAGWNVPMGFIHSMTNDCDFTKFFSGGCAPGANLSSPFCTRCVGSRRYRGHPTICNPNADEKYYGNTGAFRCLVEGAGDVAFVKHTTVFENTDRNGPEWAHNLKSADYELICLGMGPVPVTDFASCHLAQVAAHAVMAHPDSRLKVIRFLQDQEDMFGPDGIDETFRMFHSDGGRDLLFTDSTKCLKEVEVDNYENFLGNEYMTATRSFRQCSGNTPDLETSCTFHRCQ